MVKNLRTKRSKRHVERTEMVYSHDDVYGFDLGKFRYDVAALAKYLIRARESFDPQFLGNLETYKSWKFSLTQPNRDDPQEMLRNAVAMVRRIRERLLSMGGSGGVPIDDPLRDFKLAVAGFCDESSLEHAIAAIRQQKPVDWSTIACWKDLPKIRSVLDSLPHPSDPASTSASGGAQEGPRPPDEFWHDGKPFKVPGAKVYNLISYLWSQPNETARLSQLMEPVWGENAVSDGDAVGSLRRNANSFFRKNCIPFRIATAERAKVIFVSIKDCDWDAVKKIRKGKPRRPKKKGA